MSADDTDAEWTAMLEWFDGLSEGDPTRYEFEAFWYMTNARAAWRMADRLREIQRRDERKKARQQPPGQVP